MDHLTTAQITAQLVEHQRIVDGAYDTAQRRESRRAVRLYAAELTARSA